MSNTTLEPVLIRVIQLLLDDQHGISEEAHSALMELAYKVDANGKALEYLANASVYRGRVFVEEGATV